MGWCFQPDCQCADADADHLYASGLWACDEERQRADASDGDVIPCVFLRDYGFCRVDSLATAGAGWREA